MAFIGVLLSAGAEENWDEDIWKLFSDPLKNPACKAVFGTSRFESICCHIRFDDKRTRVAQLKQDKLAAFSFVWELFIENCRTQYNLGHRSATRGSGAACGSFASHLRLFCCSLKQVSVK